MKVTAIPTALKDVLIINCQVFGDVRGFLMESYNQQDFAEAGLTTTFVQDNHSRSEAKVLRGLHYQDMTAPLAKLVRCTYGGILDVVVDVRVGSPTFGQWVSVELSAENKRQVFVPVGFAHGFATLGKAAEVQYKLTSFYAPDAENTITWNDPDIGIDWPYDDPALSKRDGQGYSGCV